MGYSAPATGTSTATSSKTTATASSGSATGSASTFLASARAQNRAHLHQHLLRSGTNHGGQWRRGYGAQHTRTSTVRLRWLSPYMYVETQNGSTGRTVHKPRWRRVLNFLTSS